MSLWTSAKAAAEQTPAHRNRAADFFRAAAIAVVVIGHWIVSVPQQVDGSLKFTELLSLRPWIQYLTWVVQVMPIFFFVGGFSNAASWSSARTDKARRDAWQASRLKRLLLPIAPLILLWAAFAGLAGYLGLDGELIQITSRAALIPVWFLAVYVMVTVVVPITYMAWERFGLGTVIALIVAAVAVDAAAFGGGFGWLRWANYGFVWLAMHQLGYWWHSGIKAKHVPILLILAGLVSLYLLIGQFGYPVSMISVPGEEISNSAPPTVAMLAIGFTQAGLILLVAGRISVWLQSSTLWAIVILVGQRIMTVYLWHLTALLCIVALSMAVGGFGLHMTPGSGMWWLTRPIWFAAMIAVLLPLVAIFGRLEDGSRDSHASPPGPLRSVLGALCACAGLTFMALNGTFADNALGINIFPVAFALAGVALSTVNSRS
jgi:hypothetical protein